MTGRSNSRVWYPAGPNKFVSYEPGQIHEELKIIAQEVSPGLISIQWFKRFKKEPWIMFKQKYFNEDEFNEWFGNYPFGSIKPAKY